MRPTSIHNQLLANWKKRCRRRLYQWALEEQEPERQLFLAVSQAIYIKHFQKPIFQLAVQRNKINLLVYEPNQEVILQWITH